MVGNDGSWVILIEGTLHRCSPGALTSLKIFPPKSVNGSLDKLSLLLLLAKENYLGPLGGP
jgi:hypothetical protein